MKTVLILLAVLLLAQAPQQPELYPGQSEHKEPPKDWVCKRPEIDRIGKQTPDEQAHWCSCERMCDPETQVVHEDKACSSWCWPTHCTCGMSNANRCMPESQR